MTDHIRDSIDQNFPPEPPDDPRPEPDPPPDDALREAPLPCPKCGAPGICDDGWFVGCSDLDCTLPEMMLTDWNYLARAVALLRAVERLNDAGAAIDLVPNSNGEWVAIGSGGVSSAESATLTDVLIELAAQLEAIND